MTIQMIPLSKLVPCPANVRKTGLMTGIEELATSIKAHGLLQNLQVREGGGGKFEVVAGMRRLTALKRLAKQKHIGKTEPVACQVLDGESAAEISLAENILRLPMHPADQFEAFKTLADEGKGPKEIAARFGYSPGTVKERLKLASVSPFLFELYRAEEMSLDQLMAFTVSDDHAAQEAVWNGLGKWNRHPQTIRRELTAAHVDSDDPRALFVGLKAYKAASGHILRDLFQPEHQGYLTDPALLERLTAKKLEKLAEAVRAEGWKWVEITPEIDYGRLRQMRRVYPEREPFTEAQQAEIDRLTAAYGALIDEHGDEPSDAVSAELDALNDQIENLSAGTERWLPEDMTRAGAMIGIDHDGKIEIARGLVRPEDEIGRGDTGEIAGGKPERAVNGEKILSDRLVEDLTAHRTAALRTVLAGKPKTALVAVVHALTLPLFFPHEDESCLSIRLDSPSLHGSAEGIEDSLAAKCLDAQHAEWRRNLPTTPAALWDWLLQRDIDSLLDLLAYCAGCAVNAVQTRHERNGKRLEHANGLAVAVDLDMTEWWKPTVASYLRHVPKASILETVAEAVTPEAADNLAKLKKDALASEAERRLAGIGWLPAILRAPAAPTAEAALEAITAE